MTSPDGARRPGPGRHGHGPASRSPGKASADRPGRMGLSTGPGAGRKVFAVLLSVPFLGLPLLAISLVVENAERPIDRSSLASWLLVVPPAMIMTVFLVALLGVLRFRARLEGNVLEVRGAFTTRRVDLSRARVWLDSFPDRSRARDRRSAGGRIPHLCLYAQERGGRKVPLRLGGRRGLLPPHELAAMADAVDSGHRIGPEAEAASRTALLLRRLGTGHVTGLR
ncbi:hypothetical protein PS9374_00972 [Planomonospora sphaerica]|uniref:Uncharacterized protein n=2 Tax=Planomonospora sphaerica TaxID=161355 RepID=A0A171BMY8_9ACTN|nr:hypothetical protein PS9374_00972 [Planomonospora sphaerica]